MDLIRESPFATFEDAQRFVHWYDTHEYPTHWDEYRYGIACTILSKAESPTP